jgi:hypothetical protein
VKGPWLWWLALLLALIATAGTVMHSLALKGADPIDQRFPVRYDLGVTLPFMVVMDHPRGLLVVIIFWLLIALVAFVGLKLSQALGTQTASFPIWLAAIALLIAWSLFPILFSSDVYAYAVFGRALGVHGLDPYRLDWLAFSHFGGVDAPLRSFFGTIAPLDTYGPLWNLFAGGLCNVSEHAPLGLLIWEFRVSAGLAVLAAAGALLFLVRGAGRALGLARTSRFLFHPLVLYESAAGGHNDMLMVAPALWAFALADSLPWVAGILIGAAMAVKYVAVVALPFILVRAFSKNYRGALALLLSSIVVPVASSVAMRVHASAFANALQLQGLVITSPRWLLQEWLGRDWTRSWVAGLFAIAFVVWIAVNIGVYARRQDSPSPQLAITGLLWLSPVINPWYVQWLMPGVIHASRTANYIWWFGLFIFLRYLQDAARVPTSDAAYHTMTIALELVTLAFLFCPVILAGAGWQANAIPRNDERRTRASLNG